MATLTYPVGQAPFFNNRSVPFALLHANTLFGAVTVAANVMLVAVAASANASRLMRTIRCVRRAGMRFLRAPPPR
jgi:hypothetical protein